MRRCVVGVGVMWLVLGLTPARADDVTTLSGTTYHEVRVVRVEPDGVTWEHATGMVKVDFSDLPDAVRHAYHYDAAKAAAFQAAQTRERERFAAQAQTAQRDAEAHRVQRFQAQIAAAPATDATPGTFVYRRRAADEAAVGSVGAEIAAKKAAEDFRTKDDGTIWDRRLWAVPVFLLGGNEFNGIAFDPHTDLNSHEFKASLHHGAANEFPKSSANDAFFQPNYQTKSYYEDVDRAEAFARGRP